MSKEQNTTQAAEYPLFTNAQEIHNEPCTNEPIEGTPFRLIGNESRGYRVALGRAGMSELYPTKDLAIQCVSEFGRHTWMMLLETICVLMEVDKTLKGN